MKRLWPKRNTSYKEAESCYPEEVIQEESNASKEIAKEATPPPKTQCSASVAIIGAGMAGMSAAKHLHDNGIEDVTVLEALKRYLLLFLHI